MKATSNNKVKLQQLKISDNWKASMNEFYDLDPEGNVSNDDTFWMFGEDILQIEFDDYIIDLGWYGDEDGTYVLYLIRGDFLNGELLEKLKTRERLEIAERIDRLGELVENGDFDNISGYLVTTENGRTVNDYENFSSLRK